MIHSARENVWIQRFLNELLSEEAIRKMNILGDNQTSLTMIKNPESQNCITHINILNYYIQRLVEDRKLRIEWIVSSLTLANSLTKTLPT